MSTPSRPETSKTVEQLRLSGQLPSPQGVALAIMDICRRDDATIEAIARIVQVDPALSSQLIHLANAAAHFIDGESQVAHCHF